MSVDHPAEVPICSRAGCTNEATRSVNWRNPKIHSADRVKVWLACDAHADFLRDYLLARGFPVVVTAVGSTVASLSEVAP